MVRYIRVDLSFSAAGDFLLWRGWLDFKHLFSIEFIAWHITWTVRWNESVTGSADNHTTRFFWLISWWWWEHYWTCRSENLIKILFHIRCWKAIHTTVRSGISIWSSKSSEGRNEIVVDRIQSVTSSEFWKRPKSLEGATIVLSSNNGCTD